MKKQKSEPKHRLENLLNWWMDCWRMLEMLEQARTTLITMGRKVVFSNLQLPSGVFRPMDTHEDFAEYLRKTPPFGSEKSCGFDQKFWSGNDKWRIFQELDAIAYGLFAWTTTSKRVFSMSADLQAQLGATSLGSITWSEVKVPFPAFCIQLGEPIEHSGQHYDFLLFSQNRAHDSNTNQTTDMTLITALSTRMRDYVALTDTQIREMRGSLDYNRINDFLNMFNRYCNPVFSAVAYTTKMGNYGGHPIEQDLDLKNVNVSQVNDGPKDYTTEEIAANSAFCSTLLRTVAGLSLYLGTLPVASPRLHHCKPRGGNLDSKSIIHAAESFFVSTNHAISDSDRAILRSRGNEATETSSGNTKSTHYRRGFYHRPKGTSQDPNQAKTEWTRPTIVRPDLAAAGTIIAGANSQLKQENKK